MTHEAHWVAMPVIRTIVLGAARQGADPEAICAAAGITAADLPGMTVLNSMGASHAIWQNAVELTADTDLGLHIGEMTTPVVVGLLGPLLETSGDVGAVLINLQDYTKAFTSMYSYRLEVTPERACLHCEPIALWSAQYPDTARYSVDMAYSGLLHILRLMTGRTITPASVEYRYDAPPDVSEHIRILRTRPRWGRPANIIAFHASDLRIPVIGHNRELHAHYKRVVEEELAKRSGNGSIASDARRVVLEQFHMKLPQVSDVAYHLHMGTRTLQRRLKGEGMTFQQVADEARRDLAIGLLKNPRLTVSEVAYRLGYTEPSTFQRAFRQWTGHTPRDYRNTQAGR